MKLAAIFYTVAVVVMAATNKDVVLVVSLVLSLVSLVLLFGVTWYFQSSLDLLQQQVEYDRELLLTLQEQVNVRLMENVLCLIKVTYYCSITTTFVILLQNVCCNYV